MLGAALARATAPRRSRLDSRERLTLGALGAAFPDIDFAGFLVDPLAFLAEWHQGPTHSLVLLPLWAAALGGGFAALTRRTPPDAETILVCALGLASHIVTDAITAYGTALFYPLSASRVGLGTAFVIDPIFSLIVLIALVAAVPSARRGIAAVGLAVLGCYVGALSVLQRQALDLGSAAARARGLALSEIVALAQPFSPFNWKLIGTSGEHRYEAYLNLAGHPPLMPSGLPWLRRVAAAYRPPSELSWQQRHRYGEQPELYALVRECWEDPRLAPFRRFASYPAVSRIDSGPRETCVWFTDLRYDLPALPDTFRYGFCRAGPAQPWQLYRLRYWSEQSRQRLS